jgi:hypothetical protein
MIKRVIGVLFALLTLATIVFASLEWGNYRSMVFDFELSKLFGTLGDTTEADVEAVENEEIEDIEGAAETAEVTSEQAIDGAVIIDGAAMINGESQE